VYHEGIEESEDHQHSQHQYVVTRLYMGAADTKSKVSLARKCSGKTV